MYGGAGAADLLAAAAAWNGIAVEVSTAASSVGSVITRLSTEHWMGPASLSMAAAVQPYLVWLTCTAESSALAAAQAMASAAAFETAFALTVPPAEVVANRALLAELTATNILGQNVSAIAATEARYGEMWAQDASAMYGYAAASAVAARLNPLTRPSHITNPAGLAHQAAAVGQAGASASARQVGLSHLISDVADAVLSFASPVMSAADTGLEAVRQFLNLDVPLFVESAFHGLGGVADFATAAIGNMTLLADAMGTVGGAAPGGGAAAAVAHAVAPAGVGGTALTADLGNASVVGRLSVPASWSTAAPATAAGAALDGTGWAVPEEDGPIAVMPPAPVGNGAGEYGVRRAAASRRRHFGPVGGAATTRCPGRTAAVSRGHDGKPATNPTDPAVAGLGARCAPVDSRTRGRNREPGCAVQRAAD